MSSLNRNDIELQNIEMTIKIHFVAWKRTGMLWC